MAGTDTTMPLDKKDSAGGLMHIRALHFAKFEDFESNK